MARSYADGVRPRRRAGARAWSTTATGKFLSNGLDLDSPGQHPDEIDPYPDEIDPYLRQVCELLARVLELGVATVAALQGQTFAAGAMLFLAHDFRVVASGACPRWTSGSRSQSDWTRSSAPASPRPRRARR